MLTVDELKNISRVLKLSDVNLKLLQAFYEKYLLPYAFDYELSNGEILKLQFHVTNFCHLLGLHYITSGNQKHLVLRGTNGYKRIRDKDISFEKLENINKHQFVLNKNRILYFPFIFQLLKCPNLIDFDSSKVSKCVVECDLIFYDEYSNAYIHLGISKEKSYFYPKTFLVEPIGKTFKGTKFVEKQKHISIKKILIYKR